MLIGVPVVGGMLLRRSRHQTAELRRLGSELTSEREAHARDAAAAERNRIARELHDVISHSVSVMVVQAGAAEQQLPAESPAREQLLAVRRTGKEALTNARRHAAGAPVRVRVGRDDDRLVVDVVNGPGHALTDAVGGGHGITGMRERVAMYAGRLEAGPTNEGGWGVHARLPFPPAPVAR